MKKIIAVSLLSLSAAPIAAMAADASADSMFSVGVYANQLNLEDNSTPSQELDGEGWGVRARVAIPLVGLFVSGQAQKNEVDSNGLVTADWTDNRLGVGMEFINAGILTVDGRIEFVHLDLESGGTKFNDDGFAAHVGADAGIGILGVYGSLGYLELGEAKGPEILVGLRGTLTPFLDIFGEYRSGELKNAFGSNLKIDTDEYRVGASFSF